MIDMSSVIVPKSDQINADDLIAGSRTITITEVRITGGQEQPVSIYMEGTDKAFRPCKSMSRVLVAGWGVDAKLYAGRSLTLYRDPAVKWGGMEVGGIRISHMSHIDKPLVLVLTATKGSRKMTTVQPLKTGGWSLDDARAAIQTARDMQELEATWKNKAMAPYREQLRAMLDAQKHSLANEGTLSAGNPAATEGRDDANHGDGFDGENA